MNKISVIIALSFSVSVFAAQECYQVSDTKDAWSKTPELICVDGDVKTNKFTLTLKSGLPFNQTTVATFNLNLLVRAKRADYNQDLFGLANPSNSSFNALSVQFNGTRDLTAMREEGTVSIGATTLYYRSL